MQDGSSNKAPAVRRCNPARSVLPAVPWIQTSKPSMNMKSLVARDVLQKCGKALLVFGFFTVAVSHTRADPSSQPGSCCDAQPAAVVGNPAGGSTQQELSARWGIEVSALRLSAHGNLIDFRYRVVDPGKAVVLGNAKIKPVLVDQESGRELHVPSMPKVGQLRSTTQHLVAGKIYTALFANPAGAVKNGHKVTIVFGDFRAENLTVSE